MFSVMSLIQIKLLTSYFIREVKCKSSVFQYQKFKFTSVEIIIVDIKPLIHIRVPHSFKY